MVNSKHKILIVDDDPMNVDILEEILEEDYTLETAEDGETALDNVPVFRPDLILLDIMMPGVDGYEVCKKIRNNKNYNFIKIILVSGKASLEERLEGYQAGADDYITKPFKEEELLAKIQVFLRLKRAEELDNMKSDLLKLFSHETRTPLNGIIGLAGLLKENESLDGKTKKYANMIFQNGNRLLEFVDKTSLLCDLKNDIELEKSSQNLRKHLEQTLENLSGNIEENAIQVTLDENCDIEMCADWQMLDQVFEYVIDNAIKYSPENGEVSIAMVTHDDTKMIRIKDQGGGIEPEWIDKIFDEFSIHDIQHHKSGQGLSLAISKYIMELHGGSITVESTPGKGSSFFLYIPNEKSEIFSNTSEMNIENQ